MHHNQEIPRKSEQEETVSELDQKIGPVWFEFLASHDWLEYTYIWPKLTIELDIDTSYLIDDFKNETQFGDIQAELAWS